MKGKSIFAVVFALMTIGLMLDAKAQIGVSSNGKEGGVWASYQGGVWSPFNFVNEYGTVVPWPRLTRFGEKLCYAPLIQTDSVYLITATSARAAGFIWHDGWGTISERGFYLSKNNVFTLDTIRIRQLTPTFYPWNACTPPCSLNVYTDALTGLQPATTYYVRAYAINPCGTGYGDTLSFTTIVDYEVTVTGPTPVQICPGGSQSVTYTASVTPAMTSPTYKWYLDGTLVPGEVASTYTPTFSTTGSHTVKCEITESGVTVEGTQSVTVSTYTIPSLAITGDATICSGGTGNLTATPGFSSYAWSANVASSSTNTATYNTTDTYTVTATTSDGCTATATTTVTVYDPQVATATGITGTTTICSGSMTTLTANATASTGATLNYQWYKNGTAIGGATNATYITEALTTNTSYSCEVTAVQGGCTSTATTLNATVTIDVPTLASVTISPSPANICAGQTATLTATASGNNGTLSYQWKEGGTNVGTNSNTYTTPALNSNTTYTCMVTNTTANGCTIRQSANVTVNVTTAAVAIASIASSPSPVCIGSTATLTPTMGSYTGTLSYHWNTGATTSYITTTAINSTSTYTLTVTATNGTCTATANRSITITPQNTTATTNSVASVTCVAAELSGTNTLCSDARGFVYSATNTNPTVGGAACTALSVSNGTGSFSYALSGLTPNTDYYVKAYSHSSAGYAYGGVQPFHTNDISVAVVAQNGTINLCVPPNQTTVTFTATPDCDASNAGSTYTWVLSPTYPSTVSADGKTLTVTVTSTTAVNVTGTCTLHHSTGYTSSGSDYSIISVEGNPSEICICEDSYNGAILIDSPLPAEISQVEWKQGGVVKSTNTTGISVSSATPEGYYDLVVTNTQGCTSTRQAILGFPFDRCASLGTTGNTTETLDAGGVKQITDSRTANGNSATTYRTVQIGSQCWMAENLRYKQSMDGSDTGIPTNDLINVSIYAYPLYFTWPTSVTFTNGTTLTSAQMAARYGYLYSWIGAMDAPASVSTRSTMYPEERRDFHTQGICPDGWHLPTDAEWFQLEHKLGVPYSDSVTVTHEMRPATAGSDVLVASRGAASKSGAKAATGCEWWGYGQSISSPSVDNSPEDLCNEVRDSLGLSAVPAGVFVPEEAIRANCFKAAGGFANFWSATQGRSAHSGHDDFSDAAYARQLVANGPGWYRYRADKHNGMNVRCVRDMVTTAQSLATLSTITVGGTVLEDAGYTITERGVCWSDTGTPSILGSHRAVGSGVGAFTTTLTTSDIGSGEYQYCAYAINSEGVYYGLTKTLQILSTPQVETDNATDISTSPNSVTLHGNLLSTGGDHSTVRGICWSTSANPTISDNHLDASGSGTGPFSVTISPASTTDTYHYRAYATNARGTVYGNDMTFSLSPCAGHTTIQIQGDNYTLIEVGSQCWTPNLHVTAYADGTAIPRGNPPHDGVGWSSFSNPNPGDGIDRNPYYYEPYNVNVGLHEPDWSARITAWGRLYNWLAATRGETGSQVQGLCPNGWHVPTLADWQTLMANTNSTMACDVCKPERWPQNEIIGSPGWGVKYNGVYPTNYTNFSVHAAGLISPLNNGGNGDATPSQLNNVAQYWCGDKGTYPYYIWFQHDQAYMQYNTGGAVNAKNWGFYVRCVKN